MWFCVVVTSAWRLSSLHTHVYSFSRIGIQARSRQHCQHCLFIDPACSNPTRWVWNNRMGKSTHYHKCLQAELGAGCFIIIIIIIIIICLERRTPLDNTLCRMWGILFVVIGYVLKPVYHCLLLSVSWPHPIIRWRGVTMMHILWLLGNHLHIRHIPCLAQ